MIDTIIENGHIVSHEKITKNDKQSITLFNSLNFEIHRDIEIGDEVKFSLISDAMRISIVNKLCKKLVDDDNVDKHYLPIHFPQAYSWNRNQARERITADLHDRSYSTVADALYIIFHSFSFFCFFYHL